MLPLLLITILSIYVFLCIKYMVVKGHDLHALAFFTLYIYTIFAQIGYVFFPELSKLYNAYFGEKLFYEYWFFMFLSFFFTFQLYKKINRKKYNRIIYNVKSLQFKYGYYIFSILSVILYIVLNTYFIRFRNLFGYGGGTPMGGPWFGIGFWMLTIINIITYTLFRDKSNYLKKRFFSFIFFLISTYFFINVTVASGVRSTILYYFLSIIFYELYPFIKSIRHYRYKIGVIIFCSIFVLFTLNILRTVRSMGVQINISTLMEYKSSDSLNLQRSKGLAATILLQDYYVPSHTLFISMHYDIVDPIEVLKSNLANSLIKLDYPFLTYTITERVTGSKEERGAGWAYHYFVEGYNAAGFLGIFYNALFWNLGMILWIQLTRSNNKKHNRFMLSISVLIIMLVMRSQTSAFIQFYWLILLPGLVLSLMANNSSIAFIKYKKDHLSNE